MCTVGVELSRELDRWPLGGTLYLGGITGCDCLFLLADDVVFSLHVTYETECTGEGGQYSVVFHLNDDYIK